MLEDYLKLGQLLMIFFGVASIGWILGGIVLDYMTDSAKEGSP